MLTFKLIPLAASWPRYHNSKPLTANRSNTQPVGHDIPSKYPTQRDLDDSSSYTNFSSNTYTPSSRNPSAFSRSHSSGTKVQPFYTHSLSTDEWMAAIQFLTRIGQTCTPLRQEMILLSDVLGVSALVDSLNNPVSGGATENSVLGPFYTDDAEDSEFRSTFIITSRPYFTPSRLWRIDCI